MAIKKEIFKKDAKPLRLIARQVDQAQAQEDKKLKITPLHEAAFNGDVDTVKELLKTTAQPFAQDSFGWTPLHDAALQGRILVTQLLLAAGGTDHINAQDYEDLYTALHDAVRMNHPEIVRLLLNAGADQNLKDKAGQTALALAKEHNFTKVIEMLTKK